MELPMDDPDSSDERTSLLSTPNPQTGFTWRRALIFPFLIIFYTPLGILSLAGVQYIQLVFKEKYNITNSSYKNEACSPENASQHTVDVYDKVQQEVAMWSIYNGVAAAVPAIFMNLVWGSYSDVLGRRFLFTLGSTGAAIKVITFTLVVIFKLHLGFFVAANAIDGLTGGFSSMLAAMFAFGADITSPGKQRMTLIVIFELIIQFTVGATSLASGYLLDSAGFTLPTLVSSGISIIAVLFAGFLLPETLYADSRKNYKDISILKIISSSFKTFFRNDKCTKNAEYILLLLAFILYSIPNIVRVSLEVLYQIGEPFCWNATQVGYFAAIKLTFGTTFSLLCMYMLRKCLANDSIAIFGCVMCVGSFILEGFAITDAQLYSVNAFLAFAMLTSPMIRTLMSSMTPADNQGAMFAAIGVVETICALLGSLTNNIVYSATLSIMNGFVFLLCGFITFLALVTLIAFKILRHSCPEVVMDQYEPLTSEQV